MAKRPWTSSRAAAARRRPVTARRGTRTAGRVGPGAERQVLEHSRPRSPCRVLCPALRSADVEIAPAGPAALAQAAMVPSPLVLPRSRRSRYPDRPGRHRGGSATARPEKPAGPGRSETPGTRPAAPGHGRDPPQGCAAPPENRHPCRTDHVARCLDARADAFRIHRPTVSCVTTRRSGITLPLSCPCHSPRASQKQQPIRLISGTNGTWPGRRGRTLIPPLLNKPQWSPAGKTGHRRIERRCLVGGRNGARPGRPGRPLGMVCDTPSDLLPQWSPAGEAGKTERVHRILDQRIKPQWSPAGEAGKTARANCTP